jgi:hypothetical protein
MRGYRAMGYQVSDPTPLLEGFGDLIAADDYSS